MTVLQWISTVGSFVALCVGVTVLFNFGVTRRKAAMEAGRKEEQMEQLKKDLDHAFEKIHALEDGRHVTETALVEIRTILTNIKESLDRLSTKFDRHCEQGDDGR